MAVLPITRRAIILLIATACIMQQTMWVREATVSINPRNEESASVVRAAFFPADMGRGGEGFGQSLIGSRRVEYSWSP